MGRSIAPIVVVVLCVWVAVSNEAMAQNSLVPVSGRSGSDIIPADVLARVNLVEAHLDAIRHYLGRPPAPNPAIVVHDASPREVFFAASNLRRRLASFELERLRQATPWREPPPQNVSSADVLKQVNRALTVVLRIRGALNIQTAVEEQPESDDVTPSQVMNQLIQVGGLVNNLLDTPATLGIIYTGITHATLIGLELHRVLTSKLMPDTPAWEPALTNEDAMKHLIACYELLRSVYTKLKMPLAEVRLVDDLPRYISADDLSNLVALMIAEMVHLSSRVPGTERAPDPYPVGPKIPSDLVQRLRLLESILTDVTRSPSLTSKGITQ